MCTQRNACGFVIIFMVTDNRGRWVDFILKNVLKTELNRDMEEKIVSNGFIFIL